MPVAMGLAQPVSSGFSLRGSKRISQVPVSRSVRTPARRVVVRAADEAQKAVDEGVKGAEDAVESTKEALAPKGGQTVREAQPDAFLVVDCKQLRVSGEV